MISKKKEKIAKNLNASQLMTSFLNFHNQFDPLDSDRCESYEVLKSEVLRRLETYDEKIENPGRITE